MSRLYGKFTSDTRKSYTTVSGRELIEGVLLWGDKHNPKTAVYLSVQWAKGEELPTVTVRKCLEE